MGGQPDVGIKHRLHHLQGVAVGPEVMGNDQGDEADHAGTGGTNAITEQALYHQPQHNRTPADEDGRRVEIGDRRPALQIHAREHAEGMHDEGQQQQQEGGLAHALGAPQP